ncbi:MAG: hypothetical protein IKO49_03325 [Bacilli bacterium]|nr:hypothetical protein [Bacilli bacterium]
MKVEITDDGLRVFVQNAYFKNVDFNQKEEIVSKIKDLFISLKKRYHLHIKGLYKVKVYPHKVGVVIEAILLDEENYGSSDVDLRIIILFQKDLYLKIDDYSFIENTSFSYLYKDGYYIDLNEIDDICKYIEYGMIVSDFS